jgi:hypothetical protein
MTWLFTFRRPLNRLIGRNEFMSNSSRGLAARCRLRLLLLSTTIFSWRLLPSSTFMYASDQPPKPVTLEMVVAALEAREKQATTVQLRWNVIVHYKAGSIVTSTQAKQMRWEGKSLERGIPGEPVAYRYPCELVLKNDGMKYIAKTFRVNQKEAALTLIAYTSSYDGHESKYQMNAKPKARGTILTERRNTDVDTPALLPLMLHYRPLGETFSTLNKRVLKLSNERALIKGHNCVRIDDGRIRLFVDCGRAFIPVAFELYRKNGELLLDGEIEYMEHKTL